MTIPPINIATAQQLVTSGVVSVAALGEFIQEVVQLVQGTKTLQQIMTVPSVETVLAAIPGFNAGAPVTEDNFGDWVPAGDFLTDQEITDRVKQMTEAIAAEQFVSGFMLAVQILSMAGGGA